MAVKKKSVTLNDVAKYAGVSPRTVSNVVNDWPYVKDETREKVKEAIKAVGYRPNQTARSLVTGQTKLIGVIIPGIANTFYNLVIKGCSDVLYENGYSLVLSSSEGDSTREKYYLDTLRSHAVDAFIILGSLEGYDELQVLADDDLPLVTIGFVGNPVGEKHTLINIDNIGGAKTATTHLLKQGYRRIAHLADDRIDFPDRPTSSERCLGYQQALETYHIEADPQLIYYEDGTIQGGYRAALKLFEHTIPEAIFCYNDLMAAGAMLAVQYLGKEVPQDIAIVGFDDIMMASLLTPPLTTVRIPQYELGKFTGELILKRLKDKNGEEGIQSLLIPVELKIRESCGAVQAAKEQQRLLLEDLVSSFSVNAMSEDPIHFKIVK